MLFNSFEFALFLAATLALYNVLPHRAQNRLLLVASYVFYGAWDWRFLGLIGISTVIDFAVGRVLGRVEDARIRQRWVAVSIVTNLAILGAFKYLGFFSESFTELMEIFGWSVPTFFSDVILPVGISFYTFQTLSYTIDVYRRRFEPTDRFLDFALFVAFFPHLVAGPIERASNLLPQIFATRRLTWERWNSGCWLIFWGIYKKVVVADNLAYVVNDVYRPGSDPTSFELLIGEHR